MKDWVADHAVRLLGGTAPDTFVEITLFEKA
jgi:hypothetical protein